MKFTARREEIVNDANRTTWAKSKIRIIEIPSDHTTIEDSAISYQEIVDSVNHATWRRSKVRLTQGNPNNEDNSYGVIVYSDILEDVDYVTWKVANVRILDNPEMQSDVSTDQRNEKWFNRRYKVATENVKDMLKPYVSIDGEVDATTDNVLAFSFPDTWIGSVSSLMSYIHHYIVDFIIYEWFRMTMPTEADAYRVSSESWKQKIIDEAHSEDENAAWIWSQYAAAIEQLKDILRPFIYIQNKPVKGEDFVFQFRFPSFWNGSITSILSYIHKYIVDYILYEWYRMDSEVDEGPIFATAESWKQKIIDEAHREAENYDWFERMLQSSIDHLKGRLRWCIDEEPMVETDNTIKRPSKDEEVEEDGGEDAPELIDEQTVILEDTTDTIPEYTLRFAFSDEWRGSFESMSNYIHRYIVDYILYEWFKMTLPNEAATYLVSATEWESKIINEARSEDVRNVYFRL